MRGQIVFNPNGGESSATDGDMDAAFALFLAASFWDEPAYQAAGVRVCAALYAGCFNKSTHVRSLSAAQPEHLAYSIATGSGSWPVLLSISGEDRATIGVFSP